MKHNPNTIRKVIAPFIITFKNGVKGVEEKLKNMVKKKGRLDDMPVYKNSLQITGEFRKCFVLVKKNVQLYRKRYQKHFQTLSDTIEG